MDKNKNNKLTNANVVYTNLTIKNTNYDDGEEGIEMIEMNRQKAARQLKKGRCFEEWDCCCFSCDVDCCDF